ncbi:MAG: hypothetical protein JWP81_4233 [Ferruginibacter sp.]|nr:hypothetical protein [Ferruginibacter sp.]
MKKIALSLFAIALSAGIFAEPTNISGNTTVKTIITDDVVTSLKVYKNVEVILTNNELNEIQIVGETTDVENVTVKITRGELTVTGLPGALNGDKIVVYVPSKSLASVYIHGSSNVTSTGSLNNETIDVTINGNGKSDIKSTGLINVNTIGDFPMEPPIN